MGPEAVNEGTSATGDGLGHGEGWLGFAGPVAAILAAIYALGGQVGGSYTHQAPRWLHVGGRPEGRPAGPG